MNDGEFYEQGVRAYWEHLSIDDNPYIQWTVMSEDWEDGYMDARAMDNYDVEYDVNHPFAMENFK